MLTLLIITDKDLFGATLGTSAHSHVPTVDHSSFSSLFSSLFRVLIIALCSTTKQPSSFPLLATQDILRVPITVLSALSCNLEQRMPTPRHYHTAAIRSLTFSLF